MNVHKYMRQYFMPPQISYDWVKKDYIEKAPTSIQALAVAVNKLLDK